MIQFIAQGINMFSVEFLLHANDCHEMTYQRMPKSERCVVTHHPEAGHVAERRDVRGASGTYQGEEFYRAAHGESLPAVVTAEEIVAGIEVIHIMKTSLRSGQPERVASHPTADLATTES